MSKRFGRNQKRKLKAQLEQYQNQVAFLIEYTEQLKSSNQEALDVLDMLRSINPNFPALEEVQEINQEYYTWCNYGNYNPYSINESVPCNDTYTLNHISLNKLECELREDIILVGD